MSNLAWLIVALVVVGVAIGGYAGWLKMRGTRLERELARIADEQSERE